jgi:hypothetical protein
MMIEPKAEKPTVSEPVKDKTTSSLAAWFFEVAKRSDLKSFIVVLGDKSKDVIEKIPFSGNFDDSPWMQTSFSFPTGQFLSPDKGKTLQITLKDGTTGVVGIWVKGFQAPKDMRLLQVDLQATNTGTGDITLKGAQFTLVSGTTQFQLSTDSSSFTTMPVPADSQAHDLGMLTFVIPKAQGDFMLQFTSNQPGSQPDSVDLGTF